MLGQIIKDRIFNKVGFLFFNDNFTHLMTISTKISIRRLYVAFFIIQCFEFKKKAHLHMEWLEL